MAEELGALRDVTSGVEMVMYLCDYVSGTKKDNTYEKAYAGLLLEHLRRLYRVALLTGETDYRFF